MFRCLHGSRPGPGSVLKGTAAQAQLLETQPFVGHWFCTPKCSKILLCIFWNSSFWVQYVQWFVQLRKHEHPVDPKCPQEEVARSRIPEATIQNHPNGQKPSMSVTSHSQVAHTGAKEHKRRSSSTSTKTSVYWTIALKCWNLDHTIVDAESWKNSSA